MPYLTALIYKDNDASKVFQKIRAHPIRPGPIHWSSSANKTYKVYLSKPIPFAGTVKYTYAGFFRWRFEGDRQPPVNKSNPGKLTGWIRHGDNYYSWIRLPEATTTSLTTSTTAGSSLTTSTTTNKHLEASKPWALKRAAELWKTIEREHDERVKRMKVVEDDSIFLTFAHAASSKAKWVGLERARQLGA